MLVMKGRRVRHGNGNHRVGVVELEDHPLRQPGHVEVARPGVVDEVPQRAGDEETLLLQARFPALRGRVVGYSHRGSLLLRCRAFPSPPSCRFIPALSTTTPSITGR